MKLNFWQWLGVAMLVLVTPLWIYNKITERRTKQMGQPMMTMPAHEEESTTEPTTVPATAPVP